MEWTLMDICFCLVIYGVWRLIRFLGGYEDAYQEWYDGLPGRRGEWMWSGMYQPPRDLFTDWLPPRRQVLLTFEVAELELIEPFPDTPACSLSRVAFGRCVHGHPDLVNALRKSGHLPDTVPTINVRWYGDGPKPYNMDPRIETPTKAPKN